MTGMGEESSVRGVVRTISRTLLYSLLLVLSGCVYISPHTIRGACSNDLDSPIHNFCVVAPGTLWRGAHLTASDATWLLQHDLGSLVSLQLNDQRAFERAALESGFSRSIPYFHRRDGAVAQPLVQHRCAIHSRAFTGARSGDHARGGRMAGPPSTQRPDRLPAREVRLRAQ
jgi:hypothetical protein